MSRLLQGADIFVFPSLFEGLGIVLIESQAAGLPCVVSDTIPEDGIVTDLVRVLSLDNIKSWISAIDRVKNENRSSYAKEVISKGFDIQQTVQYLEKFYINFNSRS